MKASPKNASRVRPEEILARSMAEAGLKDFKVAAVLGSGLGDFVDQLSNPHAVPFEELDGMPRSSVVGHSGRFVLGELRGERVLVQQGRLHLYEGHSAQTVTLAVRAFAELGCRALLLTNAAGGLNPDWPVPSLMRITDHLNLQGVAPLRREEAGWGNPYNVEAGKVLDEVAVQTEVPLQRGVYAGMLGPSYETAAEIAWLGGAGAQAVGMSTVAEAMTGDACGMRVAAISLISNPAAGIATEPLNHAEVTQAGRSYSKHFARLLELGLPNLGRLVH